MGKKFKVTMLVAVFVVLVPSILDAKIQSSDPREAIIEFRTVLKNNFSILEETLPEADQHSFSKISDKLLDKSDAQLMMISILNDEKACELLSCEGENYDGALSKMATAVLRSRDKEREKSSSDVNMMIALSGGVIAILSFILTATTTIMSLRTKKFNNITNAGA